MEDLRLCLGCMNYITGLGAVCDVCGTNRYETNDNNLLQRGSIIESLYIVGKALKVNSEHVVYIGKHVDENKLYFIKEYAPDPITSRVKAGVLAVRAGCEAQYKTLMVDFLDMNQALRQFNSMCGVLPIENIVISNKTVYVIYPYSKLESLQSCLEKHWRLSWAVCKRWVITLCDLLIELHKNGIIHRGISLQTIYFDEDQNVILWDFMIPSLRTKNAQMSYQLFEGFSAPEQYHSNKWQGEWTDVYSLAAVLVKVLTGRTLEDLPGDFLVVESELTIQIPPNVIRTLQNALKKDCCERIQTVSQVRAGLLQDPEMQTNETMVFNKADVMFGTKSAELDYENMKTNDSLGNTQKSRGGELKRVMKILLLVSAGLILAMAVAVSAFLFLKEEVDAKPEKLELNLDKSEASTKNNIKKVPSLVGELYGDVIEKLGQGIVIQGQEKSDEVVPKGVIISQNPIAGANYTSESLRIDVWVSCGAETVMMPDILNLDISSAEAKLDEMEIKHEKIFVEKTDIEPNIVYKSSKEAGEEVKKNQEKVLLYLRKI